MKTSEINNRRNSITELLHEYKEVMVKDLVNEFHVSDETIRKDLTYLEKEGVLEKKHGKAVLVQGTKLKPVAFRSPINQQEKERIVQEALKYIAKDDKIIGLDQGSTVSLLSKLMSNLPEKEIFTGSLATIIQLANSHHSIHSFGGKYSSEDMAFRNETGREDYPDIHYDICFFGSSGVKNRKGFCTSSLIDAKAKRLMAEKSTKNIVLLDSTKFEETSLVQVAPWSEVDIVISTKGIPMDYQKMIEANSQLVLV